MKNTQTRNHLSPLLNHLLVNALFEFETTQTRCKEFLFHMKEGATLIAVGAAHLNGKEGLIALLRKAGYEVKPVSKK